MGRIKEWLLSEQEMQDEEPFWDYEVTFLCPTCGHPAQGYMGTPMEDGEFVDEISCSNSEEQHPCSVRIIRKHSQLTVKLDGHPDVTVYASPPGIDWDEPSPEPGAYGIFRRALGEWRSTVDEIGSFDGESSRNRMLFSNLYSIVEAYLSDTIIGAAIADVSVQRQMLKLDDLKLKDKQLSLETVLAKPNIVSDMIKTTLQGISFHNLVLVNQMCDNAFGNSILPKEKDDRKMILMSVSKRHDCVHRNGRDKEGNRHDDITSSYLRKLGTLFEGMAEALENAMGDAKVKKFFDDGSAGEPLTELATGNITGYGEAHGS
ncbi:hypothetical protein [Rhizobium leguminosarum]|uniref:hypothetical protein n=1 Tax=Rhizobium leguminosarum TaxID=384 RepID=UPI001AEB7CEF|nr:hypothetical protein [Rhizobium leguminosarum]MBP2443804.1 hypothetical protein [Rhizobium leguminosarum]